MADHVFGRGISPGRCPRPPSSNFCGFGKTRSLAVRQIDLGGIAGDDHPAVLAKAASENIFICIGRGVLRFVQG